MAVYVDDLKWAWLYKREWCHLMADSIEELHIFAGKLSLKREWFQGDHYDLTYSKRKLAVKLGAKEVSSKFMVKLRRVRRGCVYNSQ